MIPRVEVRNLSRTLQEAAAPVALVRNATFSVAAGEFVAVLGPSGC